MSFDNTTCITNSSLSCYGSNRVMYPLVTRTLLLQVYVSVYFKGCQKCCTMLATWRSHQRCRKKTWGIQR